MTKIVSYLVPHLELLGSHACGGELASLTTSHCREGLTDCAQETCEKDST